MVRFNDKNAITTLSGEDIIPITDISDSTDDKKITLSQIGDFVVGQADLAKNDLSNTGMITNAILSAPNGIIVSSSNNQSIIVKSGIKVLIPNGRGNDNKLETIEYTLPTELSQSIITLSDGNYVLFVSSEGSIAYSNINDIYVTNQAPTVSSTNAYWFNIDTNKWKFTQDNGGSWTDSAIAEIGQFSVESELITNVISNNIFYIPNAEAVALRDLSNITENGEQVIRDLMPIVEDAVNKDLNNLSYPIGETRLQGSQFTLNSCKLDSNGKADLLKTVGDAPVEVTENLGNIINHSQVDGAYSVDYTLPQPLPMTSFISGSRSSSVGGGTSGRNDNFYAVLDDDSTILIASWSAGYGGSSSSFSKTFDTPVTVKKLRLAGNVWNDDGTSTSVTVSQLTHTVAMASGLMFSVSEDNPLMLTNKNTTRTIDYLNPIDCSELANGTYLPFIKDDNSVELISNYKVSKNNKGYDIVGSPTITDGVASGFSTANFLQLPTISLGSNFEIKTKFTTGSVVSGQGSKPIIGTSRNYKGLVFFIHNTGNFTICEGNSGASSWDIISGAIGTYSVLPNTTYFVKYSFNGSTYSLSYSLDDSDGSYVTDISVNSSAIIDEFTPRLGNIISEPFNGSIDLNETYIKKNDTLYWTANSGFENSVRLDNSVLPLKLLKVVDGAEVEYNATPMTGAEVTATSGAITAIKQPTLNDNGVVISGFNCVRYPIETYVNGTSWYTVYSDGWIEQGGCFSVYGQVPITFLKPYKSLVYPFVSLQYGSTNWDKPIYFTSKSLTGIVIYAYSGQSSEKFWYACGY